MPTGGVASHFLQVLASDQRASRNRLVIGLLLAIAFGILAGVLAGGPGVAVHGGALLAGLLVGLVSARALTRRYEASIKSTWGQWMRFSPAAESIPEVYRKVHGKSGRNLPFLYAAVLFVAWGLEAGLLVLAFTQQGPQLLLSWPVIALNGVVAGLVAARGALLAKWYGGLRASVGEMVDNGEIGVWGVM